MGSLYIDSREPERVKKLFKEAKIAPLFAGDLLISGKLITFGIERKTITDLASSIRSGRLWYELKDLCSLRGIKPILVVIGSPTLLKRFSKFPITSLYAALLSVALEWSVPIIWVRNYKDLCIVINHLIKKSGEPKVPRECLVSYKPPAKTIEEEAIRILESLPRIGAKQARVLLKRGKSVKNVLLNIDKIEVKGIGEKTKKRIIEVLEYEYEG